MRCPKCGYISFDLVDECLKCKKNIQSASEVLQGAVPNIPAPSFLKFNADRHDTHDDHADFSDEISSMESDFSDDDSDFLSDDVDFSDDGAGEIEIPSQGIEVGGFEEEETIVTLDDDGPEGEIEVDLSQFEEVSDPEAAFLSDDSDVSLDSDDDMLEISVPDELADMSDLDPPTVVLGEDDDLDFDLDAGAVDLDLDDLNFDLALDDVDDTETSGSDPVQETVLSLDDIDFSDTLAEDTGADGTDKGSMDMDADLDFDLDLGGLSIHKDI
ncbi:hypothetical protein [Desulforhopalus sp. 52FAK]